MVSSIVIIGVDAPEAIVMKKIGIFAVAMLGLIVLAGFASAYKGNPAVQGPYYDEDRHEAMEEAFENNDYDAWYGLMTQDARHPRVVDFVTEDNFAEFAAAHDAAENGDFETSAQIREDLGLGTGMGNRDRSGYGNRGSGRMASGSYGACDGTGLGRSR